MSEAAAASSAESLDHEAALVREALRRLGARDREVLLLAQWEGLSPAEIGAVLGCLAVTARGNWAAVIAAIAGLVAGWAWQYGLVDFMQGPIAKATNNTDLSWLTGFVVSGGLYYILRPILAPHERAEAAVTH